MPKIKAFIERFPVLAFFLLTYLITWGLWIPFAGPASQGDSTTAEILGMWGVYGPALAGIIVTRVCSAGNLSKHRKPYLPFFFGLAISALVLFFNITRTDEPWTIGRTIVLFFLCCFVALPPAYIIASAYSRNRSVRDYLSTLIKPRGAMGYYLIALFLPPAIYWLGALLSENLGQTAYFYPSPLSGWDAVKVLSLTFLFQFFYGNVLGEEVGWRGFALPRLQTRFNPLLASLFIAAIWFSWHLPLMMGDPDEIPFLYEVLSFIPTSILLTWIYNRTGGSILAVGIAHVMGNISGRLLFPITDSRLVVGFIVAIILVFADRMWKKQADGEYQNTLSGQAA